MNYTGDKSGWHAVINALDIRPVLSVGEIVDQTGTSQSNISQHLEQLRNKNIVRSRRDANRIYYSVSNERLLDLIGTMRGVLCQTNLGDNLPE